MVARILFAEGRDVSSIPRTTTKLLPWVVHLFSQSWFTHLQNEDSIAEHFLFPESVPWGHGVLGRFPGLQNGEI